MVHSCIQTSSSTDTSLLPLLRLLHAQIFTTHKVVAKTSICRLTIMKHEDTLAIDALFEIPV